MDDLAGLFSSSIAEGNYALALAACFAGGIGVSLTPCVYPTVAITVSVFGARQAASRAQAALLSTAFVGGMVTLFTPVGVIGAMSGAMFGEQLGSPWVVFPLAVFFLAMAASMFGAFELQLPMWLQNRLGTQGGMGYRGAFALGLVSGVIAAPCTGPVVLSLLSYVSTTRDLVFGGLSFFSFAVGLSLLFWVVGTFAVSLPKTGQWVEWTKAVFGVVMAVMAIYYVRDFLPFDRPAERLPWIIGAALALVIGGAALGAIHLSWSDGTVARVRKTIGILAATAGATLAVFWIEALPVGEKIAWLEDYDRAKALARSEARPLLVDFGASWCGACGELDRNTFSDPRVVAATRGRDVVPVRIDLSPEHDSPEKRAVLRGYNQRGLPLVVLHDRSGAEIGRLTEFVEPEQFLEFLGRAR